MTAPSFGPVHTARRSERRGEQSGPCRPARGTRACPHGRATACSETHSAADPRLGEPLCPD
ncbi:replication initiator [Nocardioides sp.]|uniref:replication initiator n=1 Tax=Nocardioides sp. TaxID=35761 RepID=UPI0039C99E32